MVTCVQAGVRLLAEGVETEAQFYFLGVNITELKIRTVLSG
jgi:hypothetical protein